MTKLYKQQCANGKIMVTDGKLIIEIERINNTIYGNPLYRVYATNFIHRDFKSLSIYRNYTNKGYYLFSNYNMKEAVLTFFSDLYTLVPTYKDIPEIDFNEKNTNFTKIDWLEIH